MPARTTSTAVRPSLAAEPLGLDRVAQAAGRAKRPGNRRPPAKKQDRRALGRRRAAAGACSPAGPAAWPARSPGRRRPSRSRPSTAATASAWPCSAWRSSSAPRRGATASARSGAALADGVRWVIGSLVMVLPVVLFFAALRLLRRGPRPEARGRLAIGWLCTVASVLGIAQVVGTRPTRRTGVPGSGGLVGWAVGTPLTAGLGAVVTVVLLALLAFFGLLVITATPVHQIPERLRELGDRLLGRDDYDDEYDDDEEDEEEERRRADRPPVRPQEAASRTCSATGPVDLGDHGAIDARRRRHATTEPEHAELPPGCRAARRRPHRCRRRTCRRSPSRSSCPSSRSQGDYMLPVAVDAAPRRPAAGPVEGQRRRHRGDQRRARAVQHRRRGHRLHPRPDGHPVRGRARPGRSRSRRSPS